MIGRKRVDGIPLDKSGLLRVADQAYALIRLARFPGAIPIPRFTPLSEVELFDKMSLTAGIRLGPHEIFAPISARGMGEMYRPTDMRPDRTVAINVLPRNLSSNLAWRGEKWQR